MGILAECLVFSCECLDRRSDYLYRGDGDAFAGGGGCYIGFEFVSEAGQGGGYGGDGGGA